jgi:acyl-[acyl-carrier-protein] desaturase
MARIPKTGYEPLEELVAAVDNDVKTLMERHFERREDWYFHEFVPWEQGRSFVDEPWEASQATLSEDARTSLVLNLLTEDNLPYYHSAIESRVPDNSALKEWNLRWTAEEGQHAIALRSYLLTSRNCDPRLLEDDRMATMSGDFDLDLSNPIELFAYTSVQELATRVSHRNAGKITDDEVAFELMRRIATDENHHFMFYRDVVRAMMNHAPGAVLKGIFNVLTDFKMPGFVIPGFMRRSVSMARAGVYNMRVHHDRVVAPLLRDWGIAKLDSLRGEDAEMQEKLMNFPKKLLRQADIMDRRLGIVHP